MPLKCNLVELRKYEDSSFSVSDSLTAILLEKIESCKKESGKEMTEMKRYLLFLYLPCSIHEAFAQKKEKKNCVIS